MTDREIHEAIELKFKDAISEEIKTLRTILQINLKTAEQGNDRSVEICGIAMAMGKLKIMATQGTYVAYNGYPGYKASGAHESPQVELTSDLVDIANKLKKGPVNTKEQ